MFRTAWAAAVNDLTSDQMADLKHLSARWDLLEAAATPLKALANNVEWNLRAVGLSLQSAKRDSVQQFLGAMYSGVGNLDSGAVRIRATARSTLTLAEAMKRSLSFSAEYRKESVQRRICVFMHRTAQWMTEELDKLELVEDPVAKAVYPLFKHHFRCIIQVISLAFLTA